MKILVTGAAGFIGFHLCKKLVESGHEVTGIDNINDYYETGLKLGRLSVSGVDAEAISYNAVSASRTHGNYEFIKLDISDRENMAALFKKYRFDAVCNLAAQAGVRYSITNPYAYVDSNIVGFLNILEGCRNNGVGHLVYASSSSVYGLNSKMPFSVLHNVDHPVSLYAASKKANELMAHSYSYLYKIPVTGLRFFTVYGPWGRPDMAYFKFARAIMDGKPIDIYNYGDLKRDFTYIDDIINCILRIIPSPSKPDAAWSGDAPRPDSSPAPYRIYNIGNNNPVGLLEFIETIEGALGKKAVKNMLPMQQGDVYATWADVESLARDFGYRPDTPLSLGIKNFVEWFLDFYKIKPEKRFL